MRVVEGPTHNRGALDEQRKGLCAITICPADSMDPAARSKRTVRIGGINLTRRAAGRVEDQRRGGAAVVPVGPDAIGTP
jgi:hypothetical protein